jgi:gamma-glutamyl-gamma-aminobutyrate hydrolase PuuD
MKYYIPLGTWPLHIQPYRDLMARVGLQEGSLETADVLVLPGGADIGMRPERDKAEFHLYEEWTMAKQPVLGICRGLQVMLYLHDGDLVPHIPNKVNEMMHTTITGDWRGQSAYHTTELGLLTNTRHHQGYTSAPLGWDVLDKTSDGIIEAVQHKNQFAVQWHPEHEEMNGTAAQKWWINTVKDILYGKDIQCGK